MDYTLFQLGRIKDIITALQTDNQVNDITSLSTATKLETLCAVLGLTKTEFDSLIADNSPVLRTVKGHAFEVAFERLMLSNGCSVQDIGGDGDIDLILNGHSLQLKTPNMGGTRDSIIEYKTHKTHGAKSEVESMDYYHKVKDFAEFFVGLISYNPFKVFIIPKHELPTHPSDNRYIRSPFKISTNSSQSYINNFNQLGVNISSYNLSSQRTGAELMPKCLQSIGVGADILTDTILREANFRVWDMSIRGFAREIAIKKILTTLRIKYSDKPINYRTERADKADLVIFSNNNRSIFVQVKGISTNNCTFQGENTIIATETQLTRGRVNNHPTQSRLYLASDFEYLLLALEPPIAYKVNMPFQWALYMIPTTELNRHGIYTNRLASMQKFRLKDIQKFLVTPEYLKTVLGC